MHRGRPLQNIFVQDDLELYQMHTIVIERNVVAPLLLASRLTA